jgi:hypothetical protein
MKHCHDGFANGGRAQTRAPRPSAAAPNRRRGERFALTLLGRLQTLHGTRTVRLHDLSSWGAMVEGAPPATGIGSEAILKCHSLDVFATVLWVRGERCGIRFDAPVRDSGLEALRATSEQLGADADWSTPSA